MCQQLLVHPIARTEHERKATGNCYFVPEKRIKRKKIDRI